MKRKQEWISALLMAFILVPAAYAANDSIPAFNDHRNHPDTYFLREGDTANSLLLLPPPPAENSIAFQYDKAQYEWGKSLRQTERGAQACRDAGIDGDGVPEAFSEAFGMKIDENTPEILRLVVGMREDAGDLSTRDAKNHYQRLRPFLYFNEDTCVPTQQKELSTNGSYPSGHTAIGWATASVLAEINPERQNEILKRGYEMGQSRVICGYHFQSDVDAGRLTAAAVVARLHADPSFMKQLKKAKKEFRRLTKTKRL